MRAILIPADSDEPIQEIELDDRTPTDLIRSIRDRLGDYPEIVRTRALHKLLHEDTSWTRYPTVVMLVDEDGLNNCRLYNHRASVFYDGRIVGEAILTNEIETDGAGDVAALSSTVTVEKVTQTIDEFNAPIPSAAETVGQDIEPR